MDTSDSGMRDADDTLLPEDTETTDNRIMSCIAALNQLPAAIEQVERLTAASVNLRAMSYIGEAKRLVRIYGPWIEERALSLSTYIGQELSREQKLVLEGMIGPIEAFVDTAGAEQPRDATAGPQTAKKMISSYALLQNLRVLFSEARNECKNTRTSLQSPPRTSAATSTKSKTTMDKNTVETFTPLALEPKTTKTSAPTFLRVCSVLVKKDKCWYELRCNLCQGNALGEPVEFLQGVSGLQYHLREDHDREVSVNDVFKKNVVRSVDDFEVKVVNAATAYIETRPCTRAAAAPKSRGFVDLTGDSSGAEDGLSISNALAARPAPRTNSVQNVQPSQRSAVASKESTNQSTTSPTGPSAGDLSAALPVPPKPTTQEARPSARNLTALQPALHAQPMNVPPGMQTGPPVYQPSGYSQQHYFFQGGRPLQMPGRIFTGMQSQQMRPGINGTTNVPLGMQMGPPITQPPGYPHQGHFFPNGMPPPRGVMHGLRSGRSTPNLQPPQSSPAAFVGATIQSSTSMAGSSARPILPVPPFIAMTALPPLPGSNPAQTTNSWSRFATVPEVPNIVRVDGKEFIELHCGVCSGNAKPKEKQLLNGAQAFARHALSVHGERWRARDVLEKCKKRIIEEWLVERYRRDPSMMAIWHCKPKDSQAVGGGEDGENGGEKDGAKAGRKGGEEEGEKAGEKGGEKDGENRAEKDGDKDGKDGGEKSAQEGRGKERAVAQAVARVETLGLERR